MKYKGLTTEEVKQAKEVYGDNSLTKKNKETFLDKLKDNFNDPMIKILIVALLVSSVFVVLGKADKIETLGILLAIIIATFVSTISEYRNENTFEKLQEEASKILVKTLRNNTLVEIPIDELTVGDIVKLQSGDKVPADGIMREGEIFVDQSSLNGETKECIKKATDNHYEHSNVNFLSDTLTYRGSTVTSGSGYMEVTVVGDRSVYGKIANELQNNEERDTPLKVKLKNLADSISKFGYAGGILISIAYLFKRIVLNNNMDTSKIMNYILSDPMVIMNDILQAVMLAIIIVVMAVPEGLPLMIAIVSSQNMSKMLKDNVLVKTISGIETAGSLNIIFSDKTGTITKGKLEVIEFITGDLKKFKKFKDITELKLKKLLFANVNYNTDAKWNGKECIGGNITERALMNFVDHKNSDLNYKVLSTRAFNSSEKYSSCILTLNNGKQVTLFKGAPEKILRHCGYYINELDDIVKIDKERLNQEIDRLSSSSIRVLALAYLEEEKEKIMSDDISNHFNLTLLGLVAIKDDVRPEAIEAIKDCDTAGIQVVMVTGDKKETAVAIAKESNIIKSNKDIAITSEEMAKMTDQELRDKLQNIKVVARALPSDKSRLVRIAQDLNLVAGMTGDGTNDSPALKKADVGFAMGSGTEIAKEAADIVILDDNFKSIVNAVLYGRTIFNSIRKFIIFQLSINLSAVFISFLSPLLNIEEPLTITQILWINLVMDTLAALAFGGEPALHKYMLEKPKRRDENILSKYMKNNILTTTVCTVISSLFFLMSDISKELFDTPEKMKTGYFTLFMFIAILNSFNARTESANIFEGITKNKSFIKVISLITIIQIVMTQFGGKILSCFGLNFSQWVIILIISTCILLINITKKILKGEK